MLATGNTVLARHALGGAAADPHHRHLDHLRPLPRRHRLGDRRLRRRTPSASPATGTAGSSPTGTPATSPARWADGLVFQANPATGDQRISGTAGLAGRAGVRRGGRSGPALPGARDRRRLGRDPGDLERRRARPAQRPRLGGRAGPRGRQPLGAPAPARLGARRGPRRPAHRPRPGLRGAGPPGPGPRRPARSCTPPRPPGAPGHRRRGPRRRSASTPSGPFVGLYNVTDRAAAVPDRTGSATPGSPRRTTRWAGHALRPAATASSGSRRTPRGGSSTRPRLIGFAVESAGHGGANTRPDAVPGPCGRLDYPRST